MSDDKKQEEAPFIDPNSGASMQPGAFVSGPALAAEVPAAEEPTEPDAEPDEDEGEYSELLSGTVGDVQDYLEENPDERDAVVAAEKAGQNRKGIVES